ncbi:MAG: YdcF family protein [Terracidiphilus sp.]
MPGLPPPRPLRQQKPVPRRRPHRAPIRRAKPKWLPRIVLGAVIVVFGVFAWAVLARHLAPTTNAALARFDVIIVLGDRADSDGNPTPRMLSRVTEAVQEYERGVAPRLILTGGRTRGAFDEAQVMARVAEADGIPRSAIVLEPDAMDTIQNACFSERIMRAHGWVSAEIISNAFHVQRAAMIFGKLPIKWRTHVAPPLEPGSPIASAWMDGKETLKTVRYLVYARWADRCEP